MFSAGGQVPTHTVAPASASALAMANPYPASSATPATSARFPVRSIASMGAVSRGPAAFARAGYPSLMTPDDRERTMAEAEQDQGRQGEARCACGSRSFVLEAYLEVVDGKIAVEPVEVETLTCPDCGREYEPVLLGDGRIA